MIKALGAKQFKAVLDSEPFYYIPFDKKNHKPITMEYMWQSYEEDKDGILPENTLRRILDRAFELWKSGVSRKDAVKIAKEQENV